MLMNPDGTLYTGENVLDELGEMVEFDFSPDGRYIAIVREAEDYVRSLYIYDRATQTKTPIVLQGSSERDWQWMPNWSPDGSQLGFVVGEIGYLYSYDMQTQQIETIVGRTQMELFFVIGDHVISYDWTDEETLTLITYSTNSLYIYQNGISKSSERPLPDDIYVKQHQVYEGEVYYLCFNDNSEFEYLCAINPETRVIRYVTNLMIAGLRDFQIKDNLILLRILERIPGVENASRNVAIHNINTGQTSVIYRGDNGHTMPYCCIR